MKHYCGLFVLTLGVTVLLCSGCFKGDGLNRTSVEGTVTVDGQPVPFGNVNFYPKPGTSCPTIGAAIKEGHYIMPKKGGPVPGEYKVQIIANTTKPGKVKNLRGQVEDGLVTESILPKKYDPTQGGKETLSATVTEGKNTINFELTND
ncbi:MAG: hypothetical protein Q4G68_13960 [Planctomycetia bacterium]|nr:hypothetical protein [Planctomycetia bacterium]